MVCVICGKEVILNTIGNSGADRESSRLKKSMCCALFECDEYFYDGPLSHKEIDRHLKRTCEQFINHISSELVNPIKDFLSKVKLCT